MAFDRKSLPNALTIGRIAIIPVIVLLLVIGGAGPRVAALVLYVLAAATDWLDGYLARAWDAFSPLGRMLDPIADKLLVGVLLVALAWDGSLSALDLIPATAIMMREIFIPGLREFMGGASIIVKVTTLAKWKTTAQLVALTIVLLEGIVPGLSLVSDIVFWLAGILTVWTGVQYFLGAWPQLSGDVK